MDQGRDGPHRTRCRNRLRLRLFMLSRPSRLVIPLGVPDAVIDPVAFDSFVGHGTDVGLGLAGKMPKSSLNIKKKSNTFRFVAANAF